LFLAGSLLGAEPGGWKIPATINPGPVSPGWNGVSLAGCFTFQKLIARPNRCRF